METILNTLIENLASGHIFLGNFLLLVALLFANWSNIIAFIEDRKNAKIKVLTDALECEHIKGLMRENLKSELIKQYFRLATGINAEKDVREAILNTIESASGKLKLNHFKHADSFLTMKDSTLSLHVPRWKKFFYWVEKALCIASFCMFVFLVPLAVFAFFVAGASSVAVIAAMAAWSLVMSFLSLEQTFSVSSAEIIQRHL